MRRGIVDEVNEFNVQNALGTVDWRLTERLQLSGGAGMSWLSAARGEEMRSAPAFRAELNGIGRALRLERRLPPLVPPLVRLRRHVREPGVHGRVPLDRCRAGSIGAARSPIA